MPTLYESAPLLPSEPPHFVGREADLAGVQALLHEAALGSGSALLVEGEQGIGKSRFLRECAALKASATVVLAKCGSGSIRGHDIVRQIADWLPRSAAANARSADAVLSRLADACKRRPVAVFVDDAHLAEPAEVRALDALVALSRRVRLVVVAGYLGDAPSPAVRRLQRWVDGGARVAHLQPLSDPETELLVRSFGPVRALSSDELREILQLAQGNPRTALELAASTHAERRHGTFVAAGAETAVRALRATLARDDFAVIALCSVVGNRFADRWIVDISARSPAQVADALQAASDAGVITEQDGPPGWFRFRRPAVRVALCASIVSLKRRVIHERAVHVLSDSSDVRDAEVGHLIAHHYHVLENHANAAEWLRRVADRFSDDEQFAPAAESYARAARHLPAGSEEWLAVNLHVIRCYRNLGEWAHIIPVVHAMLATPIVQNDPRCTDALLWDLFFAYLNDGNRDAAASVAADIAKLDLPGEVDRREIASLILAYGLSYAGRVDEARALIRDIRYDALQGEEGRLRFLIATASVDALTEPLDTTLQRVDEAAAIASGLGIRGTVHAYGDGVEIAMRFGDLDMGRAYLESMSRTAEQSAGAVNGLHRNVDKDRMHLALLEGDLRTARDHVYASLEWRDGGRHNHAAVAGVGVFVGMRIGDFALVDALFDPSVLAASAAAGDAESCGHLLPGFAEVMQARGMAKELRAVLARCIEKGLVDAYTWIPLCAARFGTTDCAEAAAGLLAHYLHGAIAPAAEAHRALFAGTLSKRRGKHIAASEAAREAATRYGRLGWRLHEALAFEIAGDRRAASAAYERCGATNDAERLAGGQTRKLRRAPFGARLTTRELEVARLIAHKRSNAEIARALEISVRTVHHHVEAAFNKLGVRARWQLNADLLQGVDVQREMDSPNQPGRAPAR